MWGIAPKWLNRNRPFIPARSGVAALSIAMGQPIDGKGICQQVHRPTTSATAYPPAHTRQRVGTKIDLGGRAINTFLTCCRGQRMGIFAGSGVGKSTLLVMMARNLDLISPSHWIRRGLGRGDVPVLTLEGWPVGQPGGVTVTGLSHRRTRRCDHPPPHCPRQRPLRPLPRRVGRRRSPGDDLDGEVHDP